MGSSRESWVEAGTPHAIFDLLTRAIPIDASRVPFAAFYSSENLMYAAHLRAGLISDAMRGRR
jgi:hypothetical protein